MFAIRYDRSLDRPTTLDDMKEVAKKKKMQANNSAAVAQYYAKRLERLD
jgi:hypothetical protein